MMAITYIVTPNVPETSYIHIETQVVNSIKYANFSLYKYLHCTHTYQSE